MMTNADVERLNETANGELIKTLKEGKRPGSSGSA